MSGDMSSTSSSSKRNVSRVSANNGWDGAEHCHPDRNRRQRCLPEMSADGKADAGKARRGVRFVVSNVQAADFSHGD
jgi:hypothetical protein